MLFTIDREYVIISSMKTKEIIRIMIIEENKNTIVLKNVKCLDLALTLDCGQSFRWVEEADGSWSGAAYGKYLNIKKKRNGDLIFNTTANDFNAVWRNYFDLDRDYTKICKKLKEDTLVASTIDEYYGIRILNQEPWEALVSFVISQQNNIKRIKGIIKRLCDTYGEKINDAWNTFPSAEVLSRLSVEDFEALGTGYRGKYLKKLADDVAAGKIKLEEIKMMRLEDARQALLDIYGIGIKVADCALLFGFQFIECFPVDVWMKRVLEFYPNGLPACFKGYEGIAQQYLFHWARNNL